MSTTINRDDIHNAASRLREATTYVMNHPSATARLVEDVARDLDRYAVGASDVDPAGGVRNSLATGADVARGPEDVLTDDLGQPTAAARRQRERADRAAAGADEGDDEHFQAEMFRRRAERDGDDRSMAERMGDRFRQGHPGEDVATATEGLDEEETRRFHERRMREHPSQDEQIKRGIAPMMICGAISNSGPHGEPLACAYPPNHLDNGSEHSWASLPTFVEGRLADQDWGRRSDAPGTNEAAQGRIQRGNPQHQFQVPDAASNPPGRQSTDPSITPATTAEQAHPARVENSADAARREPSVNEAARQEALRTGVVHADDGSTKTEDELLGGPRAEDQPAPGQAGGRRALADPQMSGDEAAADAEATGLVPEGGEMVPADKAATNKAAVTDKAEPAGAKSGAAKRTK